MEEAEASPFKYSLRDDQARVRLESNPGVFECTADEVLLLVHFFAHMRMQMQPPVSDWPPKPNEIFPVDAYQIAPHPESGTVQLFLRMKGVGWSHIEFPAEDAAAVAKALTVDPLPNTGQMQ